MTIPLSAALPLAIQAFQMRAEDFDMSDYRAELPAARKRAAFWWLLRAIGCGCGRLACGAISVLRDRSRIARTANRAKRGFGPLGGAPRSTCRAGRRVSRSKSSASAWGGCRRSAKRTPRLRVAPSPADGRSQGSGFVWRGTISMARSTCGNRIPGCGWSSSSACGRKM